MQKAPIFSCPIGGPLGIFVGRWKAEILWHLKEEPVCFNHLLRMIGGISQKMLTQQLRELERDGLVERKQYEEIPPRVEYRSTEMARSLRPLFMHITSWGAEHMEDIEKAREKYHKRMSRKG